MKQRIMQIQTTSSKYGKIVNNTYTTWYSMNIDGTSNFIGNKLDIVKRAAELDLSKIYPLGCGPWNDNATNDDGSNNVFYQPECDKS